MSVELLDGKLSSLRARYAQLDSLGVSRSVAPTAPQVTVTAEPLPTQTLHNSTTAFTSRTAAVDQSRQQQQQLAFSLKPKSGSNATNVSFNLAGTRGAEGAAAVAPRTITVLSSPHKDRSHLPASGVTLAEAEQSGLHHYAPAAESPCRSPGGVARGGAAPSSSYVDIATRAQQHQFTADGNVAGDGTRTPPPGNTSVPVVSMDAQRNIAATRPAGEAELLQKMIADEVMKKHGFQVTDCEQQDSQRPQHARHRETGNAHQPSAPSAVGGAGVALGVGATPGGLPAASPIQRSYPVAGGGGGGGGAGNNTTLNADSVFVTSPPGHKFAPSAQLEQTSTALDGRMPVNEHSDPSAHPPNVLTMDRDIHEAEEPQAGLLPSELQMQPRQHEEQQRQLVAQHTDPYHYQQLSTLSRGGGGHYGGAAAPAVPQLVAAEDRVPRPRPASAKLRIPAFRPRQANIGTGERNTTASSARIRSKRAPSTTSAAPTAAGNGIFSLDDLLHNPEAAIGPREQAALLDEAHEAFQAIIGRDGGSGGGGGFAGESKSSTSRMMRQYPNMIKGPLKSVDNVMESIANRAHSLKKRDGFHDQAVEGSASPRSASAGGGGRSSRRLVGTSTRRTRPQSARPKRRGASLEAIKHWNGTVPAHLQ